MSNCKKISKYSNGNTNSIRETHLRQLSVNRLDKSRRDFSNVLCSQSWTSTYSVCHLHWMNSLLVCLCFLVNLFPHLGDCGFQKLFNLGSLYPCINHPDISETLSNSEPHYTWNQSYPKCPPTDRVHFMKWYNSI